ncbi:MAG TPA: molybdopterin-binding protein [Candidatus Nanopelagicaceae bacterium]|nr:molybdopterin-binding protein [Candidatus Nanopelagicaceae bacterium]
MRALVIVSSHRASTGVYEDRSGPILVAGLSALGFEVGPAEVVDDGTPFAAALLAGVGADYQLIVTAGGTGLTPTDVTPELTVPLLTRQIPGIPEAIRLYGLNHGVKNAALSRGVAGLAGSTLVINIAGSPGAARDALEVLADFLPHALAQISGGDH